MIEPKILDILVAVVLAAITIGLWLALYRTDRMDTLEEKETEKMENITYWK